jgi:hypothetical protein
VPFRLFYRFANFAGGAFYSSRRGAFVTKTAPLGYSSNYVAIMSLIRFGPAIWGNNEFLVLLFHAERSTLYGRESDQHSQSQAAEGVYSKTECRWIRGRAGVARSTWKVANAALCESGLIQRIPRQHRNGGDAPTEYAINWLAVKAAIEEAASAEPLPLFRKERIGIGAKLAKRTEGGGRHTATPTHSYQEEGVAATRPGGWPPHGHPPPVPTF